LAWSYIYFSILALFLYKDHDIALLITFSERYINKEKSPNSSGRGFNINNKTNTIQKVRLI